MATYNGLLNRAKSHFNLCAFLCTGAGVSTAITCTGIKTTSTIVAAFHISTAASAASMAQVDLTTLSISAANTVKDTTDTTDDQLLIFWVDVTA
ncbi:MAG: hypothetical protein WC455_12140 [Dehalococcoidia bacterium]|jgi:hypothetical protein